MRRATRYSHSPLRLLWAAVFFALLAFSASAQQNELRTVHGAVLDKAENPVASAVVYLKNVRTLAVKTYISDHAGEYRFSQSLDPNVDYEIHAEDDTMMSNKRTVSRVSTAVKTSSSRSSWTKRRRADSPHRRLSRIYFDVEFRGVSARCPCGELSRICSLPRLRRVR